MLVSTGALLVIAGSDPSGGAGIQADLKTAATIGVYGAAAITSLTVQNTLGVFSSNPVEPNLVKDQAEQVLADLPVTHIKTGMLGNSAISKVAGELLADFNGTIICDPVLRSSSGKSLLEGSAVGDLKENIISRSSALTPNFPELEALAGRKLSGDTEVAEAAQNLFSEFPTLEAVIVKGGHRHEDKTEVIDILFLKNNREIRSTRKRIATRNTHGTGCTYASALASYHMLTDDWPRSFQMAGEYLQQLLLASAGLKIGHGTGPLHHHLFTK